MTSTPPPSVPVDFNAVVARLEVGLHALNKTMDGVLTRLESMRGTNWSAVGVLAAIAVPLIAAIGWGVLSKIDANSESVMRLEHRLDARIELEQLRNNALEREMGGVQMINTLFMQGKLKMDGNGHSSIGAAQ